MKVADSPKKRKRTSSARPGRRISIQIGRHKAANMGDDGLNVRDLFKTKLKDPAPVGRYNHAHSELLKEEEDDAWDRDAKPKTTSPSDTIEKRTMIIVHALREYERRVTFGNLPSEAIPGPETQDMGGQFLTNKDRIETKSKLFEISKLVPKGALLHLHFNSELDPEELLAQARNMDNMYIRSIMPLEKDEAFPETEMVLSVLDPDKIDRDVDIFSEHYPGTAANWREADMQAKIWMKWSYFQEKYNARFPEGPVQRRASEMPLRGCCADPGRPALNAAEYWLKSKMILSPEEAYGYTQTVNGVWARFNQATRCFKGLMNYKKVYEWYIDHAIERMISEGIMYAELRPMLLDKSIPTDDGKGQVDNAGQMQMIIDGVLAKQEELRSRGEINKFPFGLKIVYCTPRSIPKGRMQEEMMQCIELKQQFPNLICGFDLVGAEDRPNHIGFYKEELLAFQETCKAKGLVIPFLFHAGETLLDTGGSGDPANSNLYDAVLLNAKRIGHGFALMKHPHLVEKFKRDPCKPGSGICVELCPISNELLHLCRNIKEHPFPELLAAGIPCTVNSDNPSLFRNSMNHEFYQIMVGAPTMSLYSWKQLARWSIEYSCLMPSEIEQGLQILDSTWRDFCQLIVDVCDDEHDGVMNGDEIDGDKAARFYAHKTDWKRKPMAESS
ncbi:deaminase [Ascochyta rabiei]|uniref:Deaminase n=2 Tax=Didymella rabiei TaxID=5454 RepID=A0A163A538_DIDRA|nr:deaminase [Ascochyta rabiei]